MTDQPHSTEWIDLRPWPGPDFHETIAFGDMLRVIENTYTALGYYCDTVSSHFEIFTSSMPTIKTDPMSPYFRSPTPKGTRDHVYDRQGRRHR